jgi:hypothetical protein
MPNAQDLRGFVGQGMSGRRARGVMPNRILDVTTGSGTVTLTKSATALIFLFGGCGSGAAQNAGTRGGGGGGAALFRRVALSAGSKIAYSVGAGGAGVITDPGGLGNAGGDTTLTLPDGRILRAGGGQGGVSGAASAAGGVAIGGDVNRTGGAGGGAGIAGSAGEDGGSSGRPAPSGNEGGGGGAAGLESIIQAGGFTYGTGSDAETVSPGTSAVGSNGRVLIIFVETAV